MPQFRRDRIRSGGGIGARALPTDPHILGLRGVDQDMSGEGATVRWGMNAFRNVSEVIG